MQHATHFYSDWKSFLECNEKAGGDLRALFLFCCLLKTIKKERKEK